MALVGDEATKEANGDLQTTDSEASEVSSDILQVTTSMKANMDQNNDLLAAFMVERNRSPTWALRETEPLPPFSVLHLQMNLNL